MIDSFPYIKKGRRSICLDGYGIIKSNQLLCTVAKRIHIYEEYELLDTVYRNNWSYTSRGLYWFTPLSDKPVYSYRVQTGTVAAFSQSFQRIENNIQNYWNNLYSGISNTDFKNLVNLYCSPNPASTGSVAFYNQPEDGKCVLYLENTITNTSILLFDKNQLKGNYSYNISITNLIPGVYYLHLSINGKTTSCQLIKQ